MGAEKQKDHQANHHHHRGQNRPHQKTITHPQGPPEPAEPDTKFLHGDEGLIRPPLPHLHGKNIPAIEHMLYGRCYQDKSTANKTNMINQTCLNIIYIKTCVLKVKISLK